MRLRASCCSRHPSVRCDSSSVVCSSFFFQAEDGIRDFHVTGVQTCALPIWEVFLFSSRYKIFQIFTRTDEFLSKCTTGITYKITPENDSVKLDLYFPTNHLLQKTPLVVFIHGGAWVEGNKDHDSIYYMRSLRDTLRTRGYAVASINYRLVNKNTHLPTPVIDCKDAV